MNCTLLSNRAALGGYAFFEPFRYSVDEGADGTAFSALYNAHAEINPLVQRLFLSALLFNTLPPLLTPLYLLNKPFAAPRPNIFTCVFPPPPFKCRLWGLSGIATDTTHVQPYAAPGGYTADHVNDPNAHGLRQS